MRIIVYLKSKLDFLSHKFRNHCALLNLLLFETRMKLDEIVFIVLYLKLEEKCTSLFIYTYFFSKT